MQGRLCIAVSRIFPALAAALALAAPGAFAARPAPTAGTLGLAGTARPVDKGDAVYIVKLREPGAASYKGGSDGYAATKPAPGGKLDRSGGAVKSYVAHIEQAQNRLLSDVGAPVAGKIYSYRYAMNGFAARLSAAEVSRLARRPEVQHIWKDSLRHVQSGDSAAFLGLLDQSGGLRADLKLRGDGIVIGVIDSGVAPQHPSLSDREPHVPRVCASDWAKSNLLGLILCHAVNKHPPKVLAYDPPADFHGVCQTGPGFTAADCNNKLVGARYYIDGFLAQYQLDPGEFRSPKDADGHGTNVATIAAGDPVTASVFGTRIGEISGIAPRARVAVYKACWLQPGDDRASCATSDLARAIDDAVADGVDIINYSIGSQQTDLTAPDDMALLNAFDAGVLTVVAAGNDGPSSATIGTPGSAPWVLTTAASTQDGAHYEQALQVTAPPDLSGELAMREASFTPPLAQTGPVSGRLVLVEDGVSQASVNDACEALANAGDLAGKIALIERGTCLFQDKLARAEAAGAIAAVVYNDSSGPPITMNGDAGSVGIPAVMIGAGDGQRLVSRLGAGADIELELADGLLLQQQDTGNRMADFSSRGPDTSDANFIKPDLTAPGVDILGGDSPDVANGIHGQLFEYLSGTSQATPQVAGIAALLKEANPDWTPAELKSALMTTAYQGVTLADGETAAGPFDMGAGHVQANSAIDPGLVYDTGYLDDAAYLCGLTAPPFPASDCAVLATAGYSFAGIDLNLPSIGAAELISGDTITRRVKNVGPAATYRASITAPPGVQVTIDPSSLTLDTGESADFTVSFKTQNPQLGSWQFGRLEWSDGTHAVDSPIAARPVTLRAPGELSLQGASGSTVLPVDFGYSGQYFPGVHGLHTPFLDVKGFVAQDPTHQFTFRNDNGVSAQDISVDPGDIYLRVALFDKYTDGNDDLDLYLFYCPTTSTCTQVGQSGGFTSNEEIDLVFPAPGLYRVLVHGFQTDQVSGGPGAHYELFGWALGNDDSAGNMQVEYTPQVTNGDRQDFTLDWGPLQPGMYLGAIAHQTPYQSAGDFYGLTLVDVTVP
jgi:hypothetical protein